VEGRRRGVLPGGNNRLDQAFVVTPDGVRIEILEDKTQSMPIRNEHIHLAVPAAEVPRPRRGMRKTFGGENEHTEQRAGRRLSGRPDALQHR